MPSEPEAYELRFLSKFLQETFGLEKHIADIAVVYCYRDADDLYQDFLKLQIRSFKLTKLVKHLIKE